MEDEGEEEFVSVRAALKCGVITRSIQLLVGSSFSYRDGDV